MKKHFKWVTILFTIIAGFYGLNAAVIFFAQPANLQQGEHIEVAGKYGTVSIVLVDELKAGGLGTLASGAKGYVNVMSPEPTIYLEASMFKGVPTRASYMYKHEMFHVLEKQLVADKVGGYPSYENPLLSFSYYFNMLKLNNDLASFLPSDNEDAEVASPFSGLEIAADCYAQDLEFVGQPMQYLGSVGCNAEQRYIVFGLLSKRWPEPLTVEQKKEAVDRWNASEQQLDNKKTKGKFEGK